MNILILTPDYPPVYGGIGIHVKSLATRLKNSNHNITVVITRISQKNNCNEKTTYYSDNGINIIDIPTNFGSILSSSSYFTSNKYYNIEMSVIWQFANSIKDIFKYLPNNNYDVIHIHDAYAGLIGKILSVYWKIPLISTIHSMHADNTSIKYYLREYIVHNSDRVIAVSEFLKNEIIKKFQIDEKKISVVYNSIEIPEIHKKEFKKNYEISFCGKFEKIKGVISLLDIFNDVFTSVHHILKEQKITLNLVGSGTLLNEIYSKIKQLNIENNVTIYQDISNIEVLKILGRSRYVVIPSQVEAFSTVGLESMLMKTPIICTNVGGMPEMVVHNKTGYIYDPNNTEQAKKYMIDLLLDSNKATKFGTEGFNRLMEHFTWETNLNKILQIYNKYITPKV